MKENKRIHNQRFIIANIDKKGQTHFNFAFVFKVIIFAKKLSLMETIIREQTVIRFRKDILNRARFKAKQNNMSLNSYLEDIIAEAVKPKIPKLPKDFQIDPVIHALSGKIPHPTKEMLDSDERLAYIVNKGN